MIEGLGFLGEVTLTFKNVKTGKERVAFYRNTITNAFYAMIADRLAGGGNDCNITYVAVGTGTYPVSPKSSTTLVSELSRTTLVAISNSGTSVNITGFFGASDAIGVLTELGFFGEAASATLNTGTMINHAPISESKTAAETLTISATIKPV